jgi:ketosteroid isomerase-like protein
MDLPMINDTQAPAWPEPPRDRPSRRATIAAGLGAGLIAPWLAAEASADPAQAPLIARLVQRAEAQARLFNTGAMARWLETADPDERFTLMQPFGGPTSHGFDRSPAHLAALAGMFRNGDASIELVQAVAGDDVVMLAYIERQQIEVGALPRQDWSLRVTQVFRRQGDRWRLVHRHADPLVRPIATEVAAALASGTGVMPAQGKGA